MRRSADHDDVTAPFTARRAFRALILMLALALAVLIAPPSSRSIGRTTATAVPAAYDQDYRPQLHYSAQKNWLNDPNGLVYYRGEYHLFYQYNPKGNTWGNMSWGHAVSRDLVHWRELPVAIPQTLNSAGESIEDIFSGSAVVDTNNTSGFGTRNNPPLVAIYTSAYTARHPTLAPAGRRSRWPTAPTAAGPSPSTPVTRSSTSDPTNSGTRRCSGTPPPRNGGWWWSRPSSGRSPSTGRPI